MPPTWADQGLPQCPRASGVSACCDWTSGAQPGCPSSLFTWPGTRTGGHLQALRPGHRYHLNHHGRSLVRGPGGWCGTREGLANPSPWGPFVRVWWGWKCQWSNMPGQLSTPIDQGNLNSNSVTSIQTWAHQQFKLGHIGKPPSVRCPGFSGMAWPRGRPGTWKLLATISWIPPRQRPLGGAGLDGRERCVRAAPSTCTPNCSAAWGDSSVPWVTPAEGTPHNVWV